MLSNFTSLLSLLADEPVKAVGLNPLGWTFLIGSVGFVVFLTLWCYTRILSLPTDPAEVAEGD